MPLPLTPTQRRARDAIKNFMDTHGGQTPCASQLAQALNITTNAAYGIMDALIARGWARKVKFVPYSFELIEREREHA